MSDGGGSNSHWAQLVVEELTRCGCRYFVISPGSRSTPLVLAAARHPRVTACVCPEERGAGFHAVGYGRAAGRPAVLVCTSGTALANYLPAVIEAAQDQVPLLVLSADRPPELQDTGANQTIVQRGIFGVYPRWSGELPVPTPRIDPRVVLTTVDQAVFRATSAPAGPVHLNCPFPEPLEPEPLPEPLVAGPAAARWRSGGEPFTVYRTMEDTEPAVAPSCPGQAPCEDAVSALLSMVAESRRGLLVAGRLPPGCAATVEALAARLGWPLLADITSGVRGTPGLQLLVQCAAGRELLRPDGVLHFGSHVVAKQYLELASAAAPRLAQVAASPDRLDPSHSAALRIVADPWRIADHLCRRTGKRPASVHGSVVRAAGARALGAVAGWAAGHRALSEPTVASLVAAAAGGPPACGLFGASSMPIRDLDTFATPLPPGVTVAANRGASGIDGAVASAAGFAAGLQGPVIALLGDLSLLHDLPSLSQLREVAPGLVIVVVNNRGGGIFSLLPLAQIEEPGFEELFERYFATPHEVAFRELAAAFNMHYAKPRTIVELRRHLAAASTRAADGADTLLEVTTERAANAALHAELRELVERAVREGQLG